MAGASPDKAELVRRFAEECDAIALCGAAPDCAERLEAIHKWFDAECARRRDKGVDSGIEPNRTLASK